MTFVLLVENDAELLKKYKLKIVAGKVFQICVYAVQIGSYDDIISIRFSSI